MPAQLNHDKINDFAAEFTQPLVAERAMRRSLKSNIKYQEKIIIKDQMMCLKHVGTEEVQCFALKVCKKIKNDEEENMKRIITFLMNLKVDDAKKEVDEAKYNLDREKEKLREVVRPNTMVEIEYQKHVRKTLQHNTLKKK